MCVCVKNVLEFYVYMEKYLEKFVNGASINEHNILGHYWKEFLSDEMNISADRVEIFTL